MKNLRLTAKWLKQWVVFVTHHLIINKPVQAVDNDGNVVESWRWSRRKKANVLRPRWEAFIKREPCGCASRFGRVILFARYPRCTAGHDLKHRRT